MAAALCLPAVLVFLLDGEAVERQLREGRSVGDVLEAVRSGEPAVLA